MSSSTPQPALQNNHPVTSTEYQLPTPPPHPVSALAFHPHPSHPHNARRFLASSWDSYVRLYQLPEKSDLDGAAKAEAVQELQSFSHEAPVLDVCWVDDELAASGGVDRRLRILNLSTGESSIIGKHTSAISRVRYEPSTKLLLTCSWDKTLKIWDPFTGSLLKTLQQPDKVLAMDISPPYPRPESEQEPEESSKRVVLAMTGRQVRIYDLRDIRKRIDARSDPTVEADGEEQWEAEQNRESSLKYMIRDLRCRPDGSGYVTSSVEGRISVEFFDPSPESQARKYAFKCHRLPVDGIDVVYPVNNMGFHPVHGTFFSLGGDAHLSYWDPFSKKRIRQLPQFPTPLSCAAFSPDGNVLVVASGAENIEEKPSMPNSQGGLQANGEVGNIGKGGPGNVALWVRENASAESKPKTAAKP